MVEFAEKLAREKEIEKALRIVECFIDDPDPCLPADEKDEESKKYNEHKKILLLSDRHENILIFSLVTHRLNKTRIRRIYHL